MSVSFEGIGDVEVTFKCDSTVKKGLTVKMSGDGAVTAAAADDRFIGVAMAVSEDGFAAVKLGGYVRLPYTGTAPTLGYVKLAAAADGAVAVKTAGGEYLAVSLDTAVKTVGFIL